ncbi:hypothetical protein Pelo_11793 [Pelomyxa schiedti]|nr:hypothetical protein Pelo_11793 [Pelomyxa schiedti]
MGGGYYGGEEEREVVSTTATQTNSATADQLFRQHALSLGITNFTSADGSVREKRMAAQVDPMSKRLNCTHRNPLIVCLDVTGSMGKFAKVMYDKLPMFYGQIMTSNYLADPAISFCAVGDAFADRAPFQATDFAQGQDLDSLVTKLYLEGNGGGNYHESYELAAWYFARLCKVTAPGARRPLIFFTGDELCYDKVSAVHIRDYFGVDFEDVKTENVFADLCRKADVYFLQKPYVDGSPFGAEFTRQVTEQWTHLIGEGHVILMENEPKMVADVLLGIIALVGGTCPDMETYIQHMRERGQTEERIAMVKNSMLPFKLPKTETTTPPAEPPTPSTTTTTSEASGY